MFIAAARRIPPRTTARTAAHSLPSISINQASFRKYHIGDRLMDERLNDSRPVVRLNHMYVVVGQNIGKLFRDPFFLEQFANSEIKHIKTTDRGEWHGVYIRGKNTYLEIFENFENKPIGSVGFGFGFDNIGETDKLYKITSGHYNGLQIRNFTMRGDEFPQFRYIEFPSISNGKINSFTVEYTPDTFRNISYKNRGEKDGTYDANNVTRERFNHSLVRTDRHFKDIEGVQLELDQETSDSFSKMLKILNFEETVMQTQGKRYTSGGFSIQLLPKRAESIIGVSIHASLFRPLVTKQVEEVQKLFSTVKENAKLEPSDKDTISLTFK